MPHTSTEKGEKDAASMRSTDADRLQPIVLHDLYMQKMHVVLILQKYEDILNPCNFSLNLTSH